ncbi:MAG: adenylate kinase [Thermomicrobia bacterium]|nr:adenylate kinase [Thermomicrobia bacterium]
MTMTLESQETITHLALGRRIAVIGMTAVGKSTLARYLAQSLGVPHVELDGVVHGPNWVDLSNEEFHARTAEALHGDGWVVDGNYAAVRDLTIGQAETVIWLDYPIIVPLWRVFPRTLRRIIRHEELWNGNRETWRGALFGRDSLVVWIVKMQHKRRREFDALFNAPEHAHRALVRLRSPRATNRWLTDLNKTVSTE